MIGLSKSSLDTYKSCARCFWLEKNGKLKRPDGIKASIMDGIDDGMKQCSDHHARNGTQMHYLAHLPGARPFPDRAKLADFMSWRTFQARVQAGPHEALIWGQLDDLILWDDGLVSAWDFKSNGKQRAWLEYTEKYNSLQADMYDILLPANGLQTTGEVYFTYTWPCQKDGLLVFQYETVSIRAEKERAIQVIADAITCLSGSEPESSPFCEYCTYVTKRAYRLKQAAV